MSVFLCSNFLSPANRPLLLKVFVNYRLELARAEHVDKSLTWLMTAALAAPAGFTITIDVGRLGSMLTMLEPGP